MATAPKSKSSTKAKPAVVSAKKVPDAAAELPTKVPAKLSAKSAVPKKTKATPVAKSTQAPKAAVGVKASKALPKKSTSPQVSPPMKEKVKKAKLVRDSFTMPEAEYAVLGEVKRTCLAAGIEVKKSQLLRIGLALLSKTEPSDLKRLIEALPPLKAGRPKVG